MVYRLLFLIAVLAYNLRAIGSVLSADLPPNIVLIMSDDQGYGDLGIHGNPVLETPHLDALARGSATIRNFYVSPVCSPTRSSLMTGRYNYRTRVVDTFKGRSMMDPDEVTVAELLRGAGYATGIFGKWHLGDNYPMRATDQGFDEALTIRGGGLAQPSDPIENDRRYTNPIVFRNNVQEQAKGFCTDVFFEGALDFIAKAQQARQPFFAYIPTNAPHDPLHDVPLDLYAKYKAKDLESVLLDQKKDVDALARTYAMVENIDQNVGRLIDRLGKLQLLENTIVIFMCDNGPASLRYVGPMRGKKSEPLEGGIRSPFYMHWPARLKAGTVSDRIAAHIDVLPTLLDAAKVPIPVDLRLDGRSLMPLLEGRDEAWPDRTLVFQGHRGNLPVEAHNIAVRTQRWKLIRASGYAKENPPADVTFELYDLSLDPKEENNLAKFRPDVLQSLKDSYTQWFADVSSTRPSNFSAPRIRIGSDRESTTTLTRQDWRVPDTDDNGREGTWLLHAEHDAKYSIELRWLKPIASGTIELQAGDFVGFIEVVGSSDRFHFESIRIPRGDLSFSAFHRVGKTVEGAYHAVLVRE